MSTMEEIVAVTTDEEPQGVLMICSVGDIGFNVDIVYH